MRVSLCLFIALCISILKANAQSNDDLYNHVDSLIVHVLDYDYTTTGRFSKKKNQRNYPEPLIILDGFPTPKEKLKGLPFHYIDKIELLTAGNQTAALYGTRGRNGAIILTTKED